MNGQFGNTRKFELAFQDVVLVCRPDRVRAREVLTEFTDVAAGTTQDQIVELEKSGGIIAHDLAVLNRLCGYLKGEPALLNGGMVYATNFSLVDLQQAGMGQQIDAIVRKHGIERRHIAIEVTETATIDPVRESALQANLHYLRRHGYQIEIDDGFDDPDFEQRYALCSPYASIFKIPKKYADQLANDGLSEHTNRVVLKTLQNAVAIHEMGLVFEGVDSTRMAARLAAHFGAHVLGQGYLYSRPKRFDQIKRPGLILQA